MTMRLAYSLFFLMIRRPPRSTLFPLHDALPIFSPELAAELGIDNGDWVTIWTLRGQAQARAMVTDRIDRKSTRMNSSHANISYAVFCLKKQKDVLSHLYHRSLSIGGMMTTGTFS